MVTMAEVMTMADSKEIKVKEKGHLTYFFKRKSA
jgi:hypothetical protein